MALSALFVLGLGLFSSCATKGGSKKSPLSSPDEDEDGESDEDEDEDETKGSGLNLPHPAKLSAFHTRVFVMTQPQPPPDRIAACFEQLTAIANEAGNQEALLTAQSQASALVANDLSVYHFCFFQMIVKLDERMDAGGPLMDDLATAFFAGIKRLWILARALDANMGREKYFDWLTKRYVQMSRDYFGRTIEVLAPPMSQVQPSEFLPSKAAGPAPVN
jgi:hypothetical protein